MKLYLLAGTSALALLAGTAGADATTFSLTGASLSFTAPTTGTYEITAAGGQGGSGAGYRRMPPGAFGGLGAIAGGEVFLNAGTVLEVVVGTAGDNVGGTGYAGAGAAAALSSPRLHPFHWLLPAVAGVRAVAAPPPSDPEAPAERAPRASMATGLAPEPAAPAGPAEAFPRLLWAVAAAAAGSAAAPPFRDLAALAAVSVRRTFLAAQATTRPTAAAGVAAAPVMRVAAVAAVFRAAAAASTEVAAAAALTSHPVSPTSG